jgi:hypothetical protein
MHGRNKRDAARLTQIKAFFSGLPKDEGLFKKMFLIKLEL